MTTTKTRPTATFILTALIVRLFMLGAAAISFSHIIATSHALGLGWEAWTVPFLIDGLAVLGMIGRSAKFAASTQRAGLRLMIGAGALSLACNVYAGHNLGQRLYGVLIVAGFVVSEWYAAKLRPATPAPVVTAQPTRTLDPQVAAERAAKAAATRATNKTAKLTPAQRGAATRKANRELAAMAAGFVPADAPVSPAPIGYP